MSTLSPWRRPVRSRQSSFAASAAAAMVACAAVSTANEEGSTGADPGSSIAPAVASGWPAARSSRRERSLHLVRSFNRTDGEQGRPTDEVAWLAHGGSEMHAEMLPTCGAVANRIYARAGTLPCGPGYLVGS